MMITSDDPLAPKQPRMTLAGAAVFSGIVALGTLVLALAIL